MKTPRIAKLAVGLGALTFVCGCTSLDAVHVKPSPILGEVVIPPAGAPYTLPFTQYEITIKRRLLAYGLPVLLENE